jgi:hypothetical protein
VSAPALTGGCLCGAVRFAISEPLEHGHYCHCTRCQRRSGAAASPAGITRDESLSIVHGAQSITSYDPGDGGWVKSFCSICGSHLWGEPPEGGVHGVRLGAIDGDPGIRPSARQFVAYAAVWEPIPDDDLTRYPERQPSD